MDASDVIRRNQQFTQWVNYRLQQSQLQPTVPFSTLCTFNASTVIHKFPTYEGYNNVVEGLKVFASTCN